MKKANKSVTLIELLVFIILVSVIILAISNIDLFSRHQVISSDRRSKLQNEASYTLEHINKNVISKAVGDSVNDPVEIYHLAGGGTSFCVYKDSDANPNGIRELTDQPVGYLYNPHPSTNNYSFIYYPNWPFATGTEVVAQKIRFFKIEHNWNGTKENFVTVTITACWDPKNITLPVSGTPPEGTANNPCVTMRAKMLMPMVSTH